jgi:hypothetical protein
MRRAEVTDSEIRAMQVFPSWYWSTWKRSCRALLDAPTRPQKALWRVFLACWALPLTWRAKWLRWTA